MTEGPTNPILHKQIRPGMQFLILIGLLIGLLFLGSSIGLIFISAKYGLSAITDVLASKPNVPHADTILWILQFTGTTFPILITPIIFSYFVVREPEDYMKNHFHFPWLLVLIVLLAMAASMPLIEYLGNLNGKMVLPKFLKSVEDWMRESEKETEKLSGQMMQMNTFGDMIYNLLFIGLLTAIVEEILFRGCFQTVFLRWSKNMHAAIWITAILFSAFHMEFYGFLPRMVLGLLFGYFTAWSGSIWPAIWAHFVNNGTIVVLTYLSQKKLVSYDFTQPQLFTNAGYIISFLLTLLLLFIYWYISSKWHNAHHGEELD
ncbi:MAG: CPBP family intramembrane glutamic endopeptidase [Sphingobacteriales bacterium]